MIAPPSRWASTGLTRNHRRAFLRWFGRAAVACAALLFASGCASSGRTPPPVPSGPQAAADPPPVTDGDVTAASVRGMQLLIKRIPGAELVAGQLVILGGVRNWGRADAGVEQLALAVSASGGTESLDKDAFTKRLATLGSMLGAVAGNDFSTFRAKSLRANWDATFELLVEAFLHPALPPAEIELQRQQQLSALKHEQEDPDGLLSLISHQKLFTGHPYENRAIGTLETVSKLSRDQLRSHLDKLRQTGRLVLVVVGDVEPEHITARARDLLGQLPKGDYQQRPLPPVRFEQATVTTVGKDLPTNYILSTFPAPGWPDADFPAAMVAMTVLGWREWIEVRTKRNLSYAPHAGMVAASEVARGTLYVTAVDPTTTMRVMLDQARLLKQEAVPAAELEGDVSTFITGLMMANETTDGQAALLARAQLLGHDWRLARSLPERMRAVTAQQIEAFASKYIVNLQTVVLGDPKKVDAALLSSL